jgi:hypothetical protein
MKVTNLALLADYGFTNPYGDLWTCECEVIEGEEDIYCNIFINETKRVYMFVSNLYDETFNEIDQTYAMPDVIFDLIKDGVITKE